MLDVCDIQVLQPLLAVHDFHFSKAHGQNFLIDAHIAEDIVRAANVSSSSGVVEIGPGVGSLTQRLCAAAGYVCAVEVDRRLEPILCAATEDFSNLKILWQDALKTDFSALVRESFGGLLPVACANLPYGVTTPVLSALLEAECFDSITVMVQREAAERIAAQPGAENYRAFSVLCQYYAEPEILFDVPPSCFMPRPGVTSSVITLHVRRERAVGAAAQSVFFRTVNATFAMRRKKLINGLAAGFPALGRGGAAEVISACSLDKDVRGETLGISEFAALTAEISARLEGTPND